MIICWPPPWCVIRETPTPPPPSSLSLSKSSSRGALMSTYLTDIHYKDDQWPLNLWLVDWNFISFTIDNQSILLPSFSYWLCFVSIYFYHYITYQMALTIIYWWGEAEERRKVFKWFRPCQIRQLKGQPSRSCPEWVRQSEGRDRHYLKFSTSITDPSCSRLIWVKFTILQEF